MTIKKKIIAFLGVLIVLFGGSATLGSVNQSNEYHATTTSAIADGHWVLQTGQSVLGSVVVASSSATTFKVWNATSTTDIASSSPVQFGASPADGTYTFDIVMSRGVVIELPANFDGSYTVTYR